jgi:hypothetical protein
VTPANSGVSALDSGGSNGAGWTAFNQPPAGSDAALLNSYNAGVKVAAPSMGGFFSDLVSGAGTFLGTTVPTALLGAAVAGSGAPHAAPGAGGAFGMPVYGGGGSGPMAQPALAGATPGAVNPLVIGALLLAGVLATMHAKGKI